MLVDFGNPLVKLFLPILLQDHTTGKNIIWATEPPENLTGMYSADDEITIEKIFEVDIKPRCLKRITDQKKRTHNKAEVFTPTWLCNKMNNNIDNVFLTKQEKLEFAEKLGITDRHGRKCNGIYSINGYLNDCYQNRYEIVVIPNYYLKDENGKRVMRYKNVWKLCYHYNEMEESMIGTDDDLF